MKKYQMVADAIRKDIHDGIYPAGSKLPKADALCDSYQVSIITVKRAMDELEAQGLIVKRRGTGTFVKELRPRELEHLSQAAPGARLPAHGVRVLHFKVRHPSPDIAEKLMLSTQDFVYDIRRTYPQDKKTSVIESLEIPTLLFPKMREHTATQSLDTYIEKELKIKLQSSHYSISARMLTEEEQSILQLTSQQPALEVSTIQYLINGSPCLYANAVICGQNAYMHTVSLH